MKDHSDASSQSSSDGSSPEEQARPLSNGSAGRRNRTRKAAKGYDEEHPKVAAEAAECQAASNPLGTSIFRLNVISITTAAEAMMAAFPDHIFQLQEIKKDHKATVPLLKRLRFAGFQVAASPSIIKNEGLSAGVLTAARKHVSVQLSLGRERDGITDDPRCIWSRLRLQGWASTILLANVYCQCGTGIRDLNVNVLRGISDATDNGRRLVIASGDWNITAYDLEASGVLKGLGLELVRPTNW